VIDTIVLTGSLNPDYFRVGQERQRPSPSGGMVSVVDFGPGPWRMAVDAEGTADLRLSVPRLVNKSGLNYPIPPLSAWDPLKTAQEVVGWLDLEPRVARRLPAYLAEHWLTDWGVRSVAFAVDVYSSSVPDVLRALYSHRERSRGQAWGGPQPEGIQWESSRRRVQCYDKAKEIENKIPRLLRSRSSTSTERSVRQLVAQHARNHIRFEVTFRGSQQVRRLAQLEPGLLPNLSWIGMWEVGAFVLTKEARALGLQPGLSDAKEETWFPCSTNDESLAVQHQLICESDRCVGEPSLPSVRNGASMMELAREIARLSEGTPGGRSRRNSAHASRILSAAGFAAVSQQMPREQLQREFRMSDSVYRDHRRFLTDLGLTVLGGDGLEDHRRLASFAEDLFLEIGGPVDSISAPPRAEASSEGPAQVVRAPWSDAMVVSASGQTDRRTHARSGSRRDSR